MKEQLHRVEEVLYNSDNEEFAYQKEKLEEVIKSKDSLAILLKGEKGKHERLEVENNLLKQELFKLKRETTSKTCKDDYLPLKVEMEEAR